MSDLEFGGTDDELAKYLGEFGARAGARVRRDARSASWVLHFGVFLATNPNDLGFRIRVAREGKVLRLTPGAIAAPWTRRKVARIVAARRAQLADYLKARLGGKAPEAFDAALLSEPFASYGATPAALSASFAWVVAAGVSALCAALLAATLVSLPIMGLSISEIAARSAAAQAAGIVALPTPAETASIGFGFRLGTAFFFGAPLGFLAGLLHAVCLGAGEASLRTSRLPQASFVFLAFSLAAAYFPFTPLWALPAALLVPTAAHAGYGFVWGLRGERRREGPRPRPALVVVGVALAAVALGALAPSTGGAPIDDRLALFRDRFLLGSGFGRAFAHAYYRYTLYAADPLKEFYAEDPKRPARSQRFATAATPELAKLLTDLDFGLLPGDAPADARVDLRTVSQAGVVVPWDSAGGSETLRKALAELSGKVFRGGWLREVSGLAWRSLFYAGPPLVVLLVIGACCPFVSVMFRAMSPRAATIALAASVVSTVLLMLLGELATAEIAEQVRRMKDSPDRIGEGLAHASPLIRHEAAHAAFRLPKVPAALAGPLLKAADDEDFRVRIWAAAALGRTGDPQVRLRLEARLADRELFVRYRAAEGLGFLGMKESVEPLLKLAREGTWYEGLYALKALRRIDPARF
jgi:hypothetical protein